MLNRRSALLILSACVISPHKTVAKSPREIMWDDLIPPGVAYSEIIGEGFVDEVNDLWNPIYDANAIKLNEALDGVLIRMPGYVIPLEVNSKGVTDFVLVPYVGACIHVPPPPANQLVMVTTDRPWPSNQLWDPVWVTGVMNTKLQASGLGQTGYTISAEEIEIYEW